MNTPSLTTKSDSVPPLDVGTGTTIAASDLELVSLECFREARKRDACAAYERYCPPEFRQFDINHPSLATYRVQIEEVLAWDPSSSRGLLLTGRTGRGKTRTMWELVRRLAYTHGIPVTYYHIVDFFSRLQLHVRDGHDYAREWIEAVASREILYLDDYGQEAILAHSEHWGDKWFQHLLNRRMELGKPLLLTTNLTAHDISQGGRVDGDPKVRRLITVAKPVPFEAR